MRPPSLRFDFECGTRAKYVVGCRCARCRAANTAGMRARTKRQIFHGKNPLVSARAARRHIIALSHSGVGRRAVAEASDIGKTTIQLIGAGCKRQIRAWTERAILAVTADAALDGAYIPAAKTQAQIRELITEGFTRAELARRLGYKTPNLQFGRGRISAVNAAKVDRFYRRTMAEGIEKS
jgi:hypothetical protein